MLDWRCLAWYHLWLNLRLVSRCQKKTHSWPLRNSMKIFAVGMSGASQAIQLAGMRSHATSVWEGNPWGLIGWFHELPNSWCLDRSLQLMQNCFKLLIGQKEFSYLRCCGLEKLPRKLLGGSSRRFFHEMCGLVWWKGMFFLLDIHTWRIPTPLPVDYPQRVAWRFHEARGG